MQTELLALQPKKRAKSKTPAIKRLSKIKIREAPLYTPPDLLEAVTKWAANCGPGALAAVLHRPVMATMEFLHSGRRWPGYTSPTLIRASLDRLWIGYESTRGYFGEDARSGERELPTYGLATVQWSGPWEQVSIQACYAHTHVIGAALRDGVMLVYDVNAGSAGGWIPWRDWCALATEIQGAIPGATGFWIRWAIEIGT